MKVILFLCAVIAVSISQDGSEISGSKPQSARDCLKNVLQKAGQDYPDLKGLLDTHKETLFKLVDKYFGCLAKPFLSKVECMNKLEKEANSFKSKLEESIPEGYEKVAQDLLEKGKKCALL